MNIEKIVNENGFSFKKIPTKNIQEKFVLKITADPNDCDLITEETVFAAKYFNESSLKVFLDVVNVLLKLKTPKNSHTHISYLWNTLTEEDIAILYQYDLSKVSDGVDFDIHDIEEYSIFDCCAWEHESEIRTWFPNDEYWMENSDLIRDCHTLHSVELFYHDSFGNIIEIIKGN